MLLNATTKARRHEESHRIVFSCLHGCIFRELYELCVQTSHFFHRLDSPADTSTRTAQCERRAWARLCVAASKSFFARSHARRARASAFLAFSTRTSAFLI